MTRYLQGICYFVCSLVLISSVLSAKASEAATYYVATTGSDSNTCTQAQNQSTPKRTINASLGCIGTADGAGANHTVIVKNGTYTEVLDNNMPGGKSWSAPFTLKAENRLGAILRPTSSSAPRGIIDLRRSTSKYIIIDGFVIDGINYVGSGNGITIKWSTSFGASHSIRIQNNEIKNMGAKNSFQTTSPGPQGIGIDQNSSGNEILNNIIHDIGVNKFDHGMYVISTKNLIEGNLVYNISGHGIQVSHGHNASTANDNVVRKNVVYNSGNAVYSGSTGSGIIIHNGDRNQVYNNIVYKNNGGIYVGKTRDSQVYNNTVYANNQSGGTKKVCARIQDTTNTRFKNNICFGNNDGLFDLRGTNTGLDSSNNLETNPSFVDAANANFKLQASSSAINKGLTLSIVSTDFYGVSRPQGSGYDIGAQEYVGNLLAAPVNLRIIEY